MVVCVETGVPHELLFNRWKQQRLRLSIGDEHLPKLNIGTFGFNDFIHYKFVNFSFWLKRG